MLEQSIRPFDASASDARPRYGNRFFGGVVPTLCTLLVLFSSHVQASWWDDLFGSDNSDSSSQTTVSGSGAPAQNSSDLPVDRISAGLKEALQVGSERVVAQLGAEDGFNADPTIRIALPPAMATARDWLQRAGMSGPMDALEVRLNRAAEQATPQARELFINAIKSMTINDARGILQGGENAATEYLQRSTGEELRNRMLPIIDQSLAQVGATQLVDTVQTQYDKIPFAPALDFSINRHVAEATAAGIFRYLGEEEKAIRANPRERTTELLKSVFAGG